MVPRSTIGTARGGVVLPTAPFFITMPPPFVHGWGQGDQNCYERLTREEDRNPQVAALEWRRAVESMIDTGGEVSVLPFHPESLFGTSSDIVYMANSGYLFRDAAGPLFVGARMLFPPRQGEIDHLIQLFAGSLGLRVRQPLDIWEGQADISRPVIGKRGEPTYILTHGIRTVLRANQSIRGYFSEGASFVPVELVDPFFHGDTCINVIRNRSGEQFIMYCPEAVTQRSVKRIEGLARRAGVRTIRISRYDALEAYAANSLEIDGTLLLLKNTSEALKGELARLGFGIVNLELEELFRKGGGGTRCCVLELRDPDPVFDSLRDRLRRDFPYRRREWSLMPLFYPTSARRAAHVRGFDFRPPALRSLPLNSDLPSGFMRLIEGKTPGEPLFKEVQSDPSTGIVVAPDDLYVTRGHEVALVVGGERHEIVRVRPGGLICWRELRFDPLAKPEVVRLEDLREGDRVLCGQGEGLVILEPDEGGREGIPFGFMGTEVTTERFQAAQTLRVAQVMIRQRAEGKKIVFVGGPAITHSDGGKYLAALIEAGWIDVFVAGNALAAHDLELNHPDYGTSLGSSPVLEVQGHPRAAPRGHEHHLRVINEARRHGSLEEFVERAGIGNRSAVRAAIKRRIPVVLTGSIRDDGPLPEVISDIVLANRRLEEILTDVGVVVGVATYLHTAQLLMQVPASVPKVIVETQGGVLSRLLEVNPLNAYPLQLDASSFLKGLCEALGVDTSEIDQPTPLGHKAIEVVAKDSEEGGDPTRIVSTGFVTKTGSAPEGFAATTNEPTRLNLGPPYGIVPVGHQKMDAVVVINRATESARVEPFRNLRLGDEVVLGRDGIVRETLSGDRTPRSMADLASALRAIKRDSKPVFLVAGPAVVSSGASPEVAWLIREGFITRLHSGVGLPLAEVEQKLFGTIFDPVNSVRALNRIRALGGLARGAFKELVPDGIFAAATDRGIQTLFSASPNDSGLFPGVVTDTLQAQDGIRHLYEGSGLVLMVGSVLHSVAAGNMGSGDIPVIVVDASPFAIGKLADRGTVQAHGFAMDAHQFFLELKKGMG